MDQYIQSVLICSVISGILEAVFPGDTMKRHLRFLSSCIMLLVLLSPLLDLIPSVGQLENKIDDLLTKIEEAEKNGTQQGEELIRSYSKEAVEQYVKEALQGEFSISTEEIEVLLEEIEDETVVHVILRGKASWTDGNRVTEFLAGKLNARVKVTRK